MLLRYFYNKKLAHASYLVGCQATGEAIIIDPGRDVELYLHELKAEGLRLVAVTETHICRMKGTKIGSINILMSLTTIWLKMEIPSKSAIFNLK